MGSNDSRREFLRVGLTGMGALSLPDLWRLRSLSAADSSGKTATARNPGPETSPGNSTSAEKTAVILVWLRGGGSHLDTYDPKPQISSDYRGPFATIDTNIPGMNVTELLPQHAQIADKFNILRSMAHTGGGHPSGSLQVLGGDPAPQDKVKPFYPDFMSVAHYLRAREHNGTPRRLPIYVGVNPVIRYDGFMIAGASYLGPAYDPFGIYGDPNAPSFSVPNIGIADPKQADRLRERMVLKRSVDEFRREVDRSGLMSAMDQFDTQALNLLTSPDAAKAFDLNQESNEIRERYGRNQWGQQCLMARRLVEAGVEIVTTTFDGPLCGRVQNWDDHAVNHNVFEALKFRAPYFDQAVSALIKDVYDRGLDKRVMVIVTGEFGRTPRITYVPSSGGGVASAAAGVVQPGRDHWPAANSMIWAGGGMQTGQVIGATDRRGETPIDRRVHPQDFLATIYRHLGIDYERIFLPDYSGRPTPIVTHGQAIKELGRVS